MNKSSGPFAADNSLHCSGCWPSFCERDRGTPPFVLSLWRKSRVCHRRPTQSFTWVMPLDEEEMGEGAVRCLITKSTRLLIGHTSTNFSVQPQAIGEKTQVPQPRNPLGDRMPTSYISLYISWEPSLFLAYCICTSPRRSSHERNRPDPQ